MKKTTERKRIVRIRKDAKQLFLNGLITASALESIGKACAAAFRKV